MVHGICLGGGDNVDFPPFSFILLSGLVVTVSCSGIFLFVFSMFGETIWLPGDGNFWLGDFNV